MATKRKCEDGKSVVQSADSLRALLSSAITSHDSAEIALLHIMHQHDFDLSMLREILSEDRTDANFSNVKYEAIASFVGLEASLQMADIDNFTLHRSRIPTTLFKSILEDMDIMQTHYGPPIMHETGEARSRFLSPIFNRLVAVFEFAFRNLPESLLEGRIATGGVEYFFKAFGSISLLFIEFKLKTGSAKERLDAIAQLIAECDAGDWNNARQGFRVAVHGILCDGDVFEFFQFDGSTEPPTFRQGRDSSVPRTGMQLPNFTRTATPRQFVNALRPICETIFDLMLNAYTLSLEAWHTRSAKKGAEEGRPRPSLDKWGRAIGFAHEALECFRNAEIMRQTRPIDEANAVVQQAMEFLKHSINEVPIIHKPALIMSGWDGTEVETV